MKKKWDSFSTISVPGPYSKLDKLFIYHYSKFIIAFKSHSKLWYHTFSLIHAIMISFSRSHSLWNVKEYTWAFELSNFYSLHLNLYKHVKHKIISFRSIDPAKLTVHFIANFLLSQNRWRYHIICWIILQYETKSKVKCHLDSRNRTYNKITSNNMKYCISKTRVVT